MKVKSIDIKGNPVIFVGNFGSGKTEVAVNFSKFLKKNSKDDICIVDLDIVNPYFRSREARINLEKEGVEVLSPKNDDHYADTPIISPVVKGRIMESKKRIVLDIGGDDLGARILSSMKDAFEDGKYELLFVLNINRPFTGTLRGCIKIIDQIEASSRLKVTGIISNSHLIEDTTDKIILKGYELSKEVSRKKGIPVKFVTVDVSLLAKIQGKIDCPVLPLTRLMLKPWEKEGNIKGL